MCKELKERLNTKDYAYIVYPNKKICIEMEDPEKATIYAKIFNGLAYDHYPYEEYGYEDPYAFTEEWTILTNLDERVSYDFTDNGVLVEVIGE